MVKTMVSCRFSLKPIQWLLLAHHSPIQTTAFAGRRPFTSSSDISFRPFTARTAWLQNSGAPWPFPFLSPLLRTKFARVCQSSRRVGFIQWLGSGYKTTITNYTNPDPKNIWTYDRKSRRSSSTMNHPGSIGTRHFSVAKNKKHQPKIIKNPPSFPFNSWG